ncbi:MAG: tetratricopeptide repeat protein [Caldilineaceae bacterium]|nr:tetratricopeptide repeat protein [Caldilineaceae bacterium]
MMGTNLTLNLLGGGQILLDGVPLHALSASKARGLLFYLAITGQAHSRDALAGLLWPDMSDVDARMNLRQALSKLRKLLPNHIMITRDQVGILPTAALFVDALAFEEALHTADHPHVGNGTDSIVHLRKAADLYRGEFLAGFFIAGAEPFEEWQLSERERLRRLILQALDRLASHYTVSRQTTLGLHYTGTLLQMDPWREENHQQMMRLLAWDGQITAALRHYQICKETLHNALGIEPLPETTALYERILALRAGPRHNLPLAQTPFVGRSQQLALLLQRLHTPTCRLVSIVGPGGVGKTRLALEIARRELPLFISGVYFVDLSNLERGDQLAAILAQTLDLTLENTLSAARQVIAHLRQQEMLLILDNFEHLLLEPHASSALDLLISLLATTPHLKIIVTSRQRLDLVEEWLFPLAGLPYSVEDDEAGAELFESTQLFAQMAQRSHPHFVLANEKAAVMQICRLVEGLPLAINLAAGLLPLRTPAQIAADLSLGFTPLAASTYNVPPRQRSIESTLDYSWRLLTEEERQQIRRLSALQNGFTAAAAAVVASAGTADLSRLVNKSWLQQQADRYSFHELVRFFAAQQLDADNFAKQQTYQVHCDYFMDHVARQAAQLDGAEMTDAVAGLHRDLPNLRHAWHWAIGHECWSALAQGIEGITLFHAITNQYGEGETLMEAAVQSLHATLSAHPHKEAELGPLLARALTYLARLFMLHRHYSESIDTVRQALLWAERYCLQDLVFQSKLCWGTALYQQGEYTEGRQRIAEAIDLAEEGGEPELLATGWQALGSIDYLVSNYAQAQIAYERALAFYESGHPHFPRQRAGLLNNIGNIHLRQGRYGEAERQYSAALALRRQGEGAPIGGIVTLNNLGLAFLGQHRYSEALSYFEEALRLYRQINQQQGEAMVLGNLADLYTLVGQYDQAQQAALQEQATMQKIGRRSRLGMCLLRLGMICHEQGDRQQAFAYTNQAMEQASSLGEQDILGQSYTLLGHLHLALETELSAEHAYQEAISIHRSIGQPHLTLDPQAGLATLAFRRRQYADAHNHVMAILDYLERTPSSQRYTSLQIYLTCAQILETLDAAHAHVLLQTGARLLQERAERIVDEQMCAAYLHNVPAHRSILALANNERGNWG